MINHHQASRLTSFLIYLISIATIGLSIARDQSMVLFIAYFSAFFCYVWIARLEQNISLIIGLGVLVRVILFFDLPHLSDDVFRFLWDGKLIVQGFNPFLLKPDELTELDPELFGVLNSQSKYTVYPPLNQALFWLTSFFGGDDYLLGTNILRSFLFLADLGSVFLLIKLSKSFGQSPLISGWFFLNPLLVIEVVGNIHFEGFVMFFTLLLLYGLSNNQFVRSGVALGLAAASKLIPLIFLPYLFLKFRWKKGIIISLAAVVVFGFSMVPLFSPGSFAGFRESLMLYSNKFEFNASIYYIIREIGWLLKGYNPIETWGPWLSFSTFISIMTMSVLAIKKEWEIPPSMLWILMIYLLMATTVHPWYILTLLPLGLLSGFYFPILWSFMVFITYLGYGKDEYEISQIWIVVEYTAVVGMAATEIFLKEQKRKNG